MPSYRTHRGLIIARKKLKEKDLLLTILTREEGKIRCLARGIRRNSGKRLGKVELGNFIKFQVYEKNSYLHFTEVESIKNAFLKEDTYTQISLYFLLFEILNLLLPEREPYPAVLTLARQIIGAIKKNDFHNFLKGEILILKALGYGPRPEITKAFGDRKNKLCQKLIGDYLETLTQKKLHSPKLFA